MTTPKKRPLVSAKAAQGLEKVLYVRATQEILDGLDAIAARMREETGLSASRSDVARKLIRDAIVAEAAR